MIGYNRVCNLSDFADEALRTVIREVFAHELRLFPQNYPDGVADSKQWEIAMAVRAFRDHGALRPDARFLGIGAGTEITTFYLSRHVHQVVATDIYAGAGPWADVAPSGFLVSPGEFADHITCEPRRILPLHQDARALDLPDDEFEGVYSSGSIEHFGSLPYVASAAYEIGRVLKPGGVAAIATEFKVAGPPDGDGWDPFVILFSREKLKHWIVEASGLEPVDELDTSLSDETLSVQRDLSSFLSATKRITHPAHKIGIYPNLVLYHEGYLFCSVHLALRKPMKGWGEANRWAAPDGATRAEVAAGKLAAVAALAAPAGGSIERFLFESEVARSRVAELEAQLAIARSRITELEAQIAAGRSQAEAATLLVTTLEAQLAAKSVELEQLERMIGALHTSTSWRLTAPLRAVVRRLRYQ